MADFKAAVAKTLKFEGHLANDLNDHGGETNYGISTAFVKHHELELKLDDSEVKEFIEDLTEAQAIGIYKEFFWPALYDGIKSQPVAEKVFDFGVNAGLVQATHELQKSIVFLGGDVVRDNIFGPKTLAALNALDPVALLKTYRVFLCDFYRGLVERDIIKAKFYDGWIKRAVA